MIIVCCSLLLQVVWPFFPSEVSVKANSRVASVLSLLAMTRSQVGEIRHVLMVQGKRFTTVTSLRVLLVPSTCSDSCLDGTLMWLRGFYLSVKGMTLLVHLFISNSFESPFSICAQLG